MKPQNTYLGASPLRTSRVGFIHSDNAAFDSVVFQQGKSLLDFDLNVLQDVLKSTTEQLARSVFSGSGFLSAPTITISSAECNFAMNPVTLNLFGKIVNISGQSGGPISISGLTNLDNAMVWLEMWYQEIAPVGTQEKINETLLSENKSSRIIQFGGIPNKSSAVVSNNIKDDTFGAETTRRVQFRWNIRADSVGTSQGFTANRASYSAAPTTTVFAKGGRTSDTDTVIPFPYVPGISPAINFYFVSSRSYIGSSSSTYEDMLKNSLEEFKNFDTTSPKIYIAGRGSAADAAELNTVDGRVYAIPLGYITKENGAYTFSLSGEATAGTGISTQGTTSGPLFSLLSNSETFGSFSTIKNGANNPYIQVQGGLSLSPGTAAVPAITFTGTSTAKNTGLFFAADASSDKIGFSVLGTEKASLSASSSASTFSLSSGVDFAAGGNITIATNKYLRVNLPVSGAPTLSASQSYINSLYVSSLTTPSVDISGGTISAKLSGQSGTGAVIDGYVDARASIDLQVGAGSISQIRRINFVAGSSATITGSVDLNKTATITIEGTTSFAPTDSGAAVADPIVAPATEAVMRTSPVSSPGQLWQEGFSVRGARRDHQHARESFATQSADISQLGTTNLAGSLGSLSRGDHSHALPRYITPMAFSSTAITAGISSATTAIEAYGTATGSTAQLSIIDTTVTPTAGVGPKLTFSGVNNASAYTSWGSIFTQRETASASSKTYISIYASSSVASSANLKETLRIFPSAISYPATLTSVASASASNQGALFSDYGMSSTYFSANAGSGTPATGSSRFLGSISGAPSVPGGGYVSWTLASGDFVIDTTGNLHIYNGTQWLTAGILTTANNGWTGVQSFGSDKTYAQLGGNSTIGANIGSSATGLGYTLTTTASGTQAKASNLYVGAPTVASGGAGTISEVSTVEIGGAPVLSATNVVSSFAGLLIRRATTSVISGTGYGARIYTPSGAVNSYGLAIEAGNALTASTTNAYGIYVNTPTGATNNYALYASGDTTVSGVFKVTNSTGSSSTTTGSVIISGGTGIAGNVHIGGNLAITGTSTFTGNISSGTSSTVSVTNTTDSSSKSTGAITISGGLGIAKSVYSGSIYSTSLQIDNNNYINARTASATGTISLAYVSNTNDVYYGDTVNSNNIYMSVKTGSMFSISNNTHRYFTFTGGGLTIGQNSNSWSGSPSTYTGSSNGYDSTNLLEVQGGWRLGTNVPLLAQSGTNYYGGLGGSLNVGNNIYSLYFRDRSDTWWNKSYIEAYDFSFRTNNFVDTSSIVSSGYASINGTIGVGGMTISGLSLSTEGLVSGMTLTKISGTGVFAAETKIASFNAATGVITLSTQAPTIGAITFSISSGFISGMQYLINTAGNTNWTSIGSSTGIGYFTYNGAAVTGTGSAYELRRGPATTRMAISNVGNVEFMGKVGIGTNSTTSTLHVVAPNTSVIEARFTGGNTQGLAVQNGTLWEYRVAADTGELGFNYVGHEDGTTYFRNTSVYNGKHGLIARFQGSTGRLGIGTDSPAQLLDVAGNIRSTGEIITTSANGLRIGTALFRNDGTNFYYLLGTSDAPGDNWGTLRPLVINNSSGNVSVGGVTTTATFNVTGTVSGAVAPRIFIPAHGFNLPTSDYPSFSQRNTGSVKYELQYANNADQWSYTTIIIPSNWSGTTITFKLNWYAATANQPIVWSIQAAVSGNGMNPNPSLSTVTTFNTNTNGASLLKTESYVWTPSTSGFSAAAGNILYIGVGRLGTAAFDTSSETINFHSLAIEF